MGANLLLKAKMKRIIKRIVGLDRVNEDTIEIIKLREKLGKNPMRLFTRRRFNKLCIKYGCFLPLNAQLGKEIVFPHGLYGIFVSKDAVIGDNCVVFHQVTIGSNNLNDSVNNGAPVIGNNVYIGCGAKIIGKCRIGNNVRIGANAVITKDISEWEEI